MLHIAIKSSLEKLWLSLCFFPTLLPLCDPMCAMIFNPFCIAGLVTHQGGWRHHVPAHKTLCPVILLLITIITIITIIIIITIISINRVREYYHY